VFVNIGGKQVYLWRAADEHGQVLDILVQEKRDTDATERFLRQLLEEASELPEGSSPTSLAVMVWPRQEYLSFRE
jgi:transposase-like protein